MLVKFPKDTFDTSWTSHVKRKMLFYSLSEQKIKGVIRNPKRKEDGVAPETIAVMQRNDKPKKKEEIWVMYAELKNKEIKKIKNKMIIISAWRYPGISKRGEGVPVPDGVLEELKKFESLI